MANLCQANQYHSAIRTHYASTHNEVLWPRLFRGVTARCRMQVLVLHVCMILVERNSVPASYNHAITELVMALSYSPTAAI